MTTAQGGGEYNLHLSFKSGPLFHSNITGWLPHQNVGTPDGHALHALHTHSAS